jgi:hypothetical protein
VAILMGFLISCQSKENSKPTSTNNSFLKKVITKGQDTTVTKDKHYNAAYNELISMLQEEQKLNFKRAVFLTEWAYNNGAIDYKDFTTDIEVVTKKLEKFIKQKGVEEYKTAGNFALYEFFTRPNWINDNQPYIYDFEDFTGQQDWEKTFVTKLMKTHKGQCRSLPFLYKILAEELNAKSYLAVAPNHFYIKHLDEQGKWVNVELTNGNFSSDAWMVSSAGISAEAIKNGIYMEALDLKQSIAHCLTELAQGYQRKYGYDEFVVLCCDKTLAYFPKSIHTMMYKHNALVHIGKEAMKKLNGRQPTPEIEAHFVELKQNEALIESLGYKELSDKEYEKWLQTIQTEKEKTMLTKIATK